MAEDLRRRDDERQALQLGSDLGLTLVDTAEMYATAMQRSWWGRRSTAGARTFSSSTPVERTSTEAQSGWLISWIGIRRY
jgi:hypothetical protein